VAHGAGRQGHVEAVDCRGHVCRAGVVVAVVDGGERHFRSVEVAKTVMVGGCGEFISFQTSQIIV
jgi:hypothetical protein